MTTPPDQLNLLDRKASAAVEQQAKSTRFSLDVCSVGTPGTASAYEQLSWEEKRELMYERKEA